jgi:hypothetical protein
MARFTAALKAAPGGGYHVAVPASAVARAGLHGGHEVRGTVNGVAFRGPVMKFGNLFQLGIPKAVAAEAKVGAGKRVTIEIELAPEPAH